MANKISLTDEGTLGPQTKWFKTQASKSDTDVFIDPKTAKSRIDEIIRAKNYDVERQIEHNLVVNKYSYYFEERELKELHSFLTPKGLAKLKNTLSKARARYWASKISFQCNLPADEVGLINDLVLNMGITREQLMGYIAHGEFDHLKSLVKPKEEQLELNDVTLSE